MDDKILVGRIGSIVGVVTTGLGAILKFRNDTRFEYDKDLRAKRIDEYRKLWTLTGRFPGYARKNTGSGVRDGSTSHLLRTFAESGKRSPHHVGSRCRHAT